MNYKDEINKIKNETKYIYVTNLLNHLSDLVMVEVKKEFKTYDFLNHFNNRYFTWDNFFYDRIIFQDNAVRMNYIYKNVVGENIKAYLFISSNTRCELDLIDAKESIDELIEDLENNFDMYYKKMYDFALKIVNHHDEIIEFFHNKEIDVFKHHEFKILEEVVPKKFRLVVSSLHSNLLKITVKTKDLKDFYFTEPIYIQGGLVDKEIILKNIEVKINRYVLKHINKSIKNHYLSDKDLRYVIVLEEKSYSKNRLYESDEIPFIYSIEDNVNDFFTKLDLTVNTIRYKKKIKKLYYEYLEEKGIVKDRDTKVKYINFIDNKLKEISFSFDDKLIDYKEVLPILEHHNIYNDMKKIFNDAYLYLSLK